MKEDSSRHFFLTSRPKSNYGNSFLLRRQSESWARNFSSPSDSRVTAIDRHWKSDENDTTRINPVFHCLPPIMVSYDYPLFFLATGISWTSFFLNTYPRLFLFIKRHIFLFLYFVNSTCGWLLLSAHLFPPEVAAVVWPWLYRDCLSVSRWVGGFCFCAGYSLVCVCVC